MEIINASGSKAMKILNTQKHLKFYMDFGQYHKIWNVLFYSNYDNFFVKCEYTDALELATKIQPIKNQPMSYRTTI